MGWDEWMDAITVGGVCAYVRTALTMVICTKSTTSPILDVVGCDQP